MNKKVIIYILALLILLGYMSFLVYIKSKELNEEVTTNQITFDNYIKNTYGILYDYLEIKKKGSLTKTRIRGYHGDLGYNWIRAYEISAPFMENSFEVWIDNRTHKVFGNNLYEVLTTDPKFQHLYSEWVKKEVGIEDEDVELKFKEALKGARYVGEKPYIEFGNINTLDNLEEDICKNTHNLYLHTVVIDNFNSLDADEVLGLVKSYEQLLKPYVFTAGDNVLWFGVKLNDLINDKEDPFNYSILFDYNTNEKKYFKYYENRPIENNKSEYITFE